MSINFYKKITLLGFGLVLIIILFLVIMFFLPKGPATIISVAPAPNTTNQKMYSDISVIFSRSLNDSEKKKVLIITSPTVIGDSSWTNGGKTYRFTPPNGFSSLTKYQITLNYPWGLKIWAFTTIDINNSLQDQETVQGKSDQKAAQGLQQYENTFPWDSQMPIMTNQYFVGFDSTNNDFIAYVYPSTSSLVPIDTQVANLKKEVLQAMSKIGIDTNKFVIQWKVSPK